MQGNAVLDGRLSDFDFSTHGPDGKRIDDCLPGLFLIEERYGQGFALVSSG